MDPIDSFTKILEIFLQGKVQSLADNSEHVGLMGCNAQIFSFKGNLGNYY